jgi:Tol biopolymer transport system component
MAMTPRPSGRSLAAIGACAAAAAILAGVAPASLRAESAATYAQFTSLNLGGDNSPAWSSDGQWVYYSSRVTGFPYVYRKAANAPMNESGSRLTAWEIEELSASASPDGGWVVMAVRDTIGRTRLWRCPAAGGAPLTKMTHGPYSDLHPHWWGTGATQEIVFATTRGGTGWQIATLTPNGTDLATAMTLVTGPGYEDLHPCFSPDGQKIVFSSDRAGSRQLFVVSREGDGWGTPVQLTSGGSGDRTNPAYSPSGLTIAFQRTGSGGTSLWFVDADGNNARVVTDASGGYDAEPAFSPTTSQMAFVSDRTGANYIWLVNDLSSPAARSSWGRIKSAYRR